ncbi:MAG TPA: 2-phospho-L-lactate guanylyltransferase [Candidatus Dormibacteraeota bacterium]|nr:2-phospho-L-lactate guanylyltransferase [Candidatus Dormibacteraeota bacterium]
MTRSERTTSSPKVWVVVLIKGFDEAKQRLRPVLEPAERRALAERNARLALAAARAGDHVLAVCGSEAAARMAHDAGAEVLLEDRPGGQNLAAQRGIEHAQAHGAGAVLLLSSDLPLVRRGTIASMLAAARGMGGKAAMAAPAVGRGGTNALYLCPPDALGLHFGDDSLEKFARDAAERRVRFQVYESPDLALDLDEPADLEELRRLVG